jgi:hypothetical protein
MFISSYLGVVDAFLVLMVLFLLAVIVMFMSSSLDVVDAPHVLMVLFLVDHDHDAHELFSWCC